MAKEFELWDPKDESMSFEEIAKADIRTVVLYDAWQILRLSFIGTWVKEADSNIEKLKEFLGDNPSPRRIRCVFNYTSGSLFRMNPGRWPKIEALHKYLKEIREEN